MDSAHDANGSGRKKTLNEEHLRQLYTYMTHHIRTCTHSGTVEGLLLYPLADDPVDVDLPLKGQRLRVRTINFQTDWQDIRGQLLGLLDDAAPAIRSKLVEAEATLAS
jgi:hypothetical protein